MSLDNKQMTGASDADQGSGINHWLSLSDEMALYILRHLPHKSLMTISLVNKKFRDLSRDDSLWTELTIDYEDIKHNEESCGELVHRCKELTIRVSTRGNSKMLGELANLEKLEVLNLMITEYHDSLIPIMKSVFKKLRKLKRVDIDFGYGLVGVGEGFVDALVTNNPDLRVLHLMNYSFLSDETLDLLANSCLGLEEFSYSCVDDGKDNRALSDRGIERMVDSAKNLKYLRLDLDLFRGRAPRVTRDQVRRLWWLYPDIHILIK